MEDAHEADSVPVTPDASSALNTDVNAAFVPSENNATVAPAGQQAAPTGTALAQLRTLEVKGRAPKTGYDRESFGWRDDVDRNGCDTRNDILRRDLKNITTKAGTQGCVVLSGRVDSPYSGSSYDFVRNPTNTDIDHVVALSDAWQSGASSWDAQKKIAFANDPLNLLAVESTLNRQKGDGDAATWLPPHKPYRCEYVARQVALKAKYGLWVKPAEAEAIERVLTACPDMKAYDQNVQPPATDSTTEAKPVPIEKPRQAGKPAALVRVVETKAPKTAPAKKSAPKPAQKSAPKPAKKSAPKPAKKSASKSSKKSASKPAKKHAKKPAKTPAKKPAKKPAKTPAKKPAPKKKSSGSGGFRNCAEAWKKGAAPLHRGKPGYTPKLDRDGDGVACEWKPRR
ncbi:excalibur calcium-binding domain-containing protein [Dermabacter hominis]|uniref:GmrSD restriction endonuclease domain-containing protein n=1 Tax=Dermabacter hominis TaxID=36740 RepID=UPI0021A2C056|nr:DUF1524 domain-containing protein [Dermabacter hominis]MCT2083186.1 excalibur calcium-binding domain-containing protein [Dermabacter hominis]MCT2091419.1 excalibur calcium-binding domain-containing protein [Dermabacter hominis]MCT2190113.1 excalibur calcium-binding domain-containing protein [Dermabacter hominis]